MLVVAYIGFGNSVKRYHLPYVKIREDKIKVKMIYRRKEDREGDEKEETYYPTIHFTTNLKEVMEDTEINLIVVNSPDDTHIYYSKMALDHGKHVLIEKPVARNYEDAKMIFDYAKEKGLIAMCNNNRRFDADFRTVKKVIDSKVLGEIIEVESHYDYFRPTINYKGFGMLYGLGVHPIDQIISLFGKPKALHYDVRSIHSIGESDDYYDIDFYYGKYKAIVKTSFAVKLDYPRFIVHGKKGSFLMPAQGHQSALAKKKGPVEIDFTRGTTDKWGTISYIDDYGNDITEKIPNEIGDYGLIYDNLYDVIFHQAEKIVKDEEVLLVLKIIEEATEVGRKACE